MLTFVQHGDFSKTDSFLERMKGLFKQSIFDKYGEMGVEALRNATPVDTGLTASSWSYKVNRSKGQLSIEWYNDNRNGEVVIAVILQYGHGTGTGGYVNGVDYINPAIKPVFDKIANDIWEEVCK